MKATHSHMRQILAPERRAIEFRAWRIPDATGGQHSYPLNVSAAIDLKEAIHLACTSPGNVYLAHKDHLLIQCADHVRGRSQMFLYRIVKLARRHTARGWEEPLEPRFIIDWPVWTITMVEPADVVANPTGIDPRIIEGKSS